jgi:glycosyltransferase involved in cell wall biosynthesis
VRIAQLAPLYESVPPKGYGGTERVVAYLTEALVAMGHEVTLFASGDSRTSAKLVRCVEQSLRLCPRRLDPVAMHVLLVEQAFQRAHEFDVIHGHLDHLFFPLARRCPVPVVTTLHGRLDLEWLVPLHREFAEQWMVSISDAQRAPLPWLRWIRTVHHGLPRDLYRWNDRPSDALCFLGRISPEKRVDRAIDVALRTGRRLRIAAKVDPADEAYFRAVIEPRLDHPEVEFVGELGDADKGAFLGDAAALLFPIDWPEPFGLTMIEAFACGTPVIAWPHGSVPEILEHGVTGFLCDDLDAAVRAVGQIDRIDRAACRRVFEERFTAERMARDYLSIYELLREDPGIGGPPVP